MVETGISDKRNSAAKPDSLPLVSVILPTYNSGKTIARALRSALAQSYTNLEIVIADDASSDDTRRQVEAFADPRITFLPSQEATNKGPAVTRNRALAKAQGIYVAFLDSDDEWFPDKLGEQVAYLEAHPACSIVVTNAYDVSPQGVVFAAEFDRPTIPATGAEAWRVLLKYSFIETSSVMSRRALIGELGGFDPNLLVSQDQDLWIRLATRGEVGIIDRVYGRIHQVVTGHMTRNRRRQVDIMLPMIERHVARLADKLSKREIDEILGYRYQVAGRNIFLDGKYRVGIDLLAKASRHNGNWLGNFFYICHANPLGVALKGLIKPRLTPYSAG